MRNFDAILVNWSIDGNLRISGDIYSDNATRLGDDYFTDAERVNTSPIQRVDRTIDGPVAVTRSGTRYLLA